MKVTISGRAEKNLDEIMKYLESDWSLRVKENFRQKLIPNQNPYSFIWNNAAPFDGFNNIFFGTGHIARLVSIFNS